MKTAKNLLAKSTSPILFGMRTRGTIRVQAPALTGHKSPIRRTFSSSSSSMSAMNSRKRLRVVRMSLSTPRRGTGMSSVMRTTLTLTSTLSINSIDMVTATSLLTVHMLLEVALGLATTTMGIRGLSKCQGPSWLGQRRASWTSTTSWQRKVSTTCLHTRSAPCCSSAISLWARRR